ncbi:MAG: PhzF family phenazine biosynthesis protein [Vicinamibacteria bacterium]|nr:PhzF family phenazine biosynthesis protein [Vicinamibacteria bacterium]
MKLQIFQLDAFSDRLFAGNPAAVCPLPGWAPDAVLQAIAAENNLAETAFLVGGNGRYHIRWLTPEVEVDLCGHATLASAWVVFHKLEPGRAEVTFDSASGPLTVRRRDELLELDFPARPATTASAPVGLAEALRAAPLESWSSQRDWLAVFATASDVRALRPDMHRLRELGVAVVATAPGEDEGCDFVSRFFAPALGVDEDPVTGSAHCVLAPFWHQRLGRNPLHARQVSKRGGTLECTVAGDRVLIAGAVTPYLEGMIEV